MKKILLLLIFSATTILCIGQQDSLSLPLPGTYTNHIYKDAGFAVAPVLRYNTSQGTSFAGSFKMRMFLGNRFSFDSDITIGKDYLTFGPGLIGIPLWLIGFPSEDESGYSLSELLGIGAIALLTAEHTAYHIPLKNFTDLSPYISLLKFRTRVGNNPDNPYAAEDNVCFGMGIELNKYFSKFVLSPFVEYNQAYGDPVGHMYAGVYFGFYVFKKIR